MKKPAQGGLGEFDDDVLGNADKAFCTAGDALRRLSAGRAFYEVFPGRESEAVATPPLVTTRPLFRAMPETADCAAVVPLYPAAPRQDPSG